MRHVPGWVVAALGTAALVAAFYAGGVLGASRSASAYIADASSIATAPAPADTALEVECEPSQRAIARHATATAVGSVACVSVAPADAAAGASGTSPARATRVAYGRNDAYRRPAVTDEPMDVYRPRSVPVSYDRTPAGGSREVARPTRSVRKSAVVIATTTAAGATIGGLTKGRRGALIGGLIGGGAATVWDQVTRRRDDSR